MNDKFIGAGDRGGVASPFPGFPDFLIFVNKFAILGSRRSSIRLSVGRVNVVRTRDSSRPYRSNAADISPVFFPERDVTSRTNVVACFRAIVSLTAILESFYKAIDIG